MGNALASIIINNYNYGKYICSAIDSALKQSYSNIEVIVVDDGSTDDSHALIREYGKRIKPILKGNGGQGSAYNAGFTVSKGDVVAFLDADDMLHKDAVYHTMEEFKGPDVAKVQFRLEIIDEEGKTSGIHVPAGRMPSGNVLDILLRYGGYGSPPASGNAYRRSALSMIMPIPESDWRIAADSVPSLSSPFFGNVRSIEKVLGYYRVHNKGQRINLGRPGNAASLSGKIQEFLKAEKYLGELCARYKKDLQVNVISRNPSMLKTLLSFKIVEPNHIYNAEYRVSQLVLTGISASIKYPLYSGFHRISIISWFMLVAISPSAIRRKLIIIGMQPAVRGFNLK